MTREPEGSTTPSTKSSCNANQENIREQESERKKGRGKNSGKKIVRCSKYQTTLLLGSTFLNRCKSGLGEWVNEWYFPTLCYAGSRIKLSLLIYPFVGKVEGCVTTAYIFCCAMVTYPLFQTIQYYDTEFPTV